MAGKSLTLVALAVTLSAVGAFAADPPAPAGKQRLICRGGGERSLGSHIRRAQRCRTVEQWQQEEEEKGRLPVSLQVTAGQNDGRVVSAPH
jgi:hypothetical protein